MDMQIKLVHGNYHKIDRDLVQEVIEWVEELPRLTLPWQIHLFDESPARTIYDLMLAGF